MRSRDDRGSCNGRRKLHDLPTVEGGTKLRAKIGHERWKERRRVMGGRWKVGGGSAEAEKEHVMSQGLASG